MVLDLVSWLRGRDETMRIVQHEERCAGEMESEEKSKALGLR